MPVKQWLRSDLSELLLYEFNLNSAKWLVSSSEEPF